MFLVSTTLSSYQTVKCNTLVTAAPIERPDGSCDEKKNQSTGDIIVIGQVKIERNSVEKSDRMRRIENKCRRNKATLPD